jgi:hypothetical protein
MDLFRLIKNEKIYVLHTRLTGVAENITTIILFQKYENSIDKMNESCYNSLDDTLLHLDKHVPLICVFTGSQVLTKYSHTEDELFVDELMDPDFYSYCSTTVTGWKIQSIARKSVLQPVLQKIIDYGFFVEGFSLGFGVIQALENLSLNVSFCLDDLCFTFRDNILKNISQEKSDTGIIQIENNTFTDKQIYLLAGILKYIGSDLIKDDVVLNSSEKFHFFRKSRFLFALILCVVFIILAANFIAISMINKNLNVVNEKNITLNHQYMKIEVLEKQLQEYSRLIINLKPSSNISFSLASDRIILCKPDGIWLNNLVVQPFIRKIDSNKLIETKPTEITINGVTLSPLHLNSFINNLKNEKWINDVQLISYQKIQTGLYGEFTIEIIKNEER